MTMVFSSLITLLVPAILIIAMSIAEYYVARKFKLWGLVIPVVSCILSFLLFFFLIGAAIQFIQFIVIFRKQKKQEEMDKMNIQDL
ncbi:hypothetical protein [Christensenella intestinihominis]|uniref:hypothetical protein n=1 Tax=Christensenella intestinihominis TaxID=1851429 RepID=UPI00082FFF95|nr:hypothetical protein [Christensenella intestinihominis]